MYQTLQELFLGGALDIANLLLFINSVNFIGPIYSKAEILVLLSLYTVAIVCIVHRVCVGLTAWCAVKYGNTRTEITTWATAPSSAARTGLTKPQVSTWSLRYLLGEGGGGYIPTRARFSRK
jgi:hypothetical protein